MNKYIKEVSENIYSFNLEKFMSTQGLIYHKYELNDVGINLIDKYLFQILEEIHEVNNSSNKEKQAEELIDVIMYLGSTYYTMVDTTTFNCRTINTNNEKLDVKKFMDNLFSAIISARRMYPERKWHKKYSKDEIIRNRNKIFSEIVIYQIQKIVRLLLTNYDAETIDNLINKKQEFIGKLKETNDITTNETLRRVIINKVYKNKKNKKLYTVMSIGKHSGNIMNFTRINKKKARRLYDDGATLYIVPCKVYLELKGAWIRPCDLKKSDVEEEYKGFADLAATYSFDSRVNNFEYYNCNYELGSYTAFYTLDE